MKHVILIDRDILIPKSILDLRDISTNEKIMLCYIAEIVKRERVCLYTNEAFGAFMGYCKRQVIRFIRGLENAKYIKSTIAHKERTIILLDKYYKAVNNGN